MHQLPKMRKVSLLSLAALLVVAISPVQTAVYAEQTPQLSSVFEDFGSLGSSPFYPWLIVDSDPAPGFDFIAPMLGCTPDGVACTSLEVEDGVTYGRTLFDGTKPRQENTWYMAAFQVMPFFGEGLGMSTPTQEVSWVMEWRARYDMQDGSAGGWFTTDDFSTGFGYNWLGDSVTGDLNGASGLAATVVLDNEPLNAYKLPMIDPTEWNTYRQTWYVDAQGGQHVQFEIEGRNGTVRKTRDLSFPFNSMYSTFWVDNQVDLFQFADIDSVQYQDIDWIHVYQTANQS